jgi:release factor glutamine methyltransferase
MKVREALNGAAGRLAAVSDTARLDAELLMAHTLGVEREALLLHRLDDESPANFRSLVDRRLAHEPVAYLTGRRAFWTIELEVGPGVLIPRPDSETLIEAAVARFGKKGPGTILDLGTGPGTLLLAALDQWPKAIGTGVDNSETALAYARRNAERLGLADRARIVSAEWGEGLDQKYDLILSNPPYVESGAVLSPDVAAWEPDEALYAGSDGLDAYRALAPMLPLLLAPGGLACIEIGAGQEKEVSWLFGMQGFTIESRRDLRGIVRCLVLTRNRL